MNGHVKLALAALSLLLAATPPSRGAPLGPGAEADAEIMPGAADGPVALAKVEDFAYEIVRPDKPSGQTLVLLHGSGGNETSLVKLAARIAHNATLLGIRGRVTQEGRTRWYRRITPVSFDQQDIRAESDAFARFLDGKARELDIDLGRTVFLGYSNGANLIAATALLHPGLVRKAALLRPMPVLDQPPAPALAGLSLLMVAGEADSTYAPFAPKLEQLLESCGASVDARFIPSDHGIGEEDARIVAEWLATPGK